MDSVHDMLFDLAGVFIFGIAVSVFLLFSRNLNTLLLTTKNNINENYVLYEQIKDISYDDIREVPYQDVIGLLMGDLNVDVKVNNEVIKCEEYDYMLFDFSTVAKTNYHVSYEYNTTGYVTRINFTSIR